MLASAKNHVASVAMKFGKHFSDFASAIAVPYTTADGWLKQGRIPKWRHGQILAAANRMDIQLTKEELEGTRPVGADAAQLPADVGASATGT